MVGLLRPPRESKEREVQRQALLSPAGVSQAAALPYQLAWVWWAAVAFAQEMFPAVCSGWHFAAREAAYLRSCALGLSGGV